MGPDLLLIKGTPFHFLLPSLHVGSEQEKRAGLSEAQVLETKEGFKTEHPVPD